MNRLIFMVVVAFLAIVCGNSTPTKPEGTSQKFELQGLAELQAVVAVYNNQVYPNSDRGINKNLKKIHELP